MSAADRGAMLRALGLAAKARGRTRPNPMVGAVVVRDGVTVGEGYHRRAGSSHAEVEALRAAGYLAAGATLYVTLEPCNHHGRTPPCADAILAAGVRRVVVAMRDPNPDVTGRGAERLRAEGVEVEVGLCEDDARALNRVFLANVLERRPFVHLKMAATLDGRITASDGSSRWITGLEARHEVHRLRAGVDAVCAGVGTVLEDNPELTARDVGARKQPARVVFDSTLRTPVTSRLVETVAAGPVIAIARPGAHDGRRAALEQAGVAVLEVPGEGSGRGVAIREALAALVARGVCEVLVEGGATLAASLVASDVVDRYLVMVAPKLVGGGTPLLGDIGVTSMSEARELRLVAVRRLGEDFVVEAEPRRTRREGGA